MTRLLEVFGRFFDRRKRSEPVVEERRQEPQRRQARQRAKQADQQLDEALDDLTTLLGKRHSKPKARAMNDMQQTVIFSTFREICRFATSKEFAVRFCRHPKHEAANTGMATCNEGQCPITAGKSA